MLLFRDVEIGRRRGLDCLVGDGTVLRIGPGPRRVSGAEVIDGRGGALIPGLADHHLHLLALAAAAGSADLAGPARLEDTVAAAARAVPAGHWVRLVGYDDGAHGPLDRRRLDACAPRTPVRVQHRGGALWVVNSAGAELLGLGRSGHPGVERDAAGELTGRLWRADALLRGVTGAPPDLAPVGRRLAALGITHVSDASPDDDGSGAVVLAAAARSGALPQHVQVMGAAGGPGLRTGPRKIVVADHEPPALDELAGRIRTARADGRAVALHCVTRVALLLALAALDEAGVRSGDRIEHCSVADAGTVARLAAMGLRVVTQPVLVASRGDDYLARVPVAEHADLWRHGSLLRAGVPAVVSSDAPYGDVDPWAGIRAAAGRRTPAGAVLGDTERVDAAAVLAGLLSPLERPGGPPRRLAPGAPADLVLLDRPPAALDDARVRCTVIDGVSVHRTEE